MVKPAATRALANLVRLRLNGLWWFQISHARVSLRTIVGLEVLDQSVVILIH